MQTHDQTKNHQLYKVTIKESKEKHHQLLNWGH